jgi:hypothetical protein
MSGWETIDERDFIGKQQQLLLSHNIRKTFKINSNKNKNETNSGWEAAANSKYCALLKCVTIYAWRKK